MLCFAAVSSKIFLATPSPRRSYASLRIFLPQLQETLLKNPVPCRLRGGGGPLSALRQQGSRAVLVRLQRDHVEEKRLKPIEPGVRVCASTNSLLAPSRSMAAPTKTMSSLIAAKSANARKNPPRNFESSSATRRSRLTRTYPGNATNSSSAVVHTADCPSCRTYNAKPSVTKSNCLFFPRSKQSS